MKTIQEILKTQIDEEGEPDNDSCNKATPGRAIKEFCKECVGSRRSNLVKNCGGEKLFVTGRQCPLFPYRLKGHGSRSAIRKHCIECMGGNYPAVNECTTSTCTLWLYRNRKFTPKSETRIKLGRELARRRQLNKL